MSGIAKLLLLQLTIFHAHAVLKDEVVCRLNCPYGFEIDENGDGICRCIDHCNPGPCSKNQTCIIEELSCPTGNCGIRVKCIKTCPLQLPCHQWMKCAHGYAVDCDNCSTCSCNDPCAGIVCPKKQRCIVHSCLDLNCQGLTVSCETV